MYVRWERRRTVSTGNKAQFQLVALLVDGEPSTSEDETEVVTWLGAIEERFLHVRISRTKSFHQGIFWVKVDQRLKNLCLEAQELQLIEAQISEKVPRPGDDWALWGVTCIPHIDC